MLKTVFMGTPSFSVESLKYLYENTDLKLVVTKEDKINKRSNGVEYSPVKKYCIDNNIECIQPKSIRKDSFFDILNEIKPDLIVVAAYGKIIPKNIIDLPKYGIINVHSSLLPKYRGASPIHYALINGDEQTGISIMQIEEGLDTGDVYHSVKIDISNDDNLYTLTEKLSKLSYDALAYVIPKIIDGSITKVKQDDSKAVIVSPIPKSMHKIDFNNDATEIRNLIRGVYPDAYMQNSEKRVKLLNVEVIEKQFDSVGKICELTKIGPVISCKKNSLLILSAKFEGKKEQRGIDIVNGRKLKLEEDFNEM